MEGSAPCTEQARDDKLFVTVEGGAPSTAEEQSASIIRQVSDYVEQCVNE